MVTSYWVTWSDLDEPIVLDEDGSEGEIAMHNVILVQVAAEGNEDHKFYYIYVNMWQSRIDYSVVYFERITEFDVL